MSQKETVSFRTGLRLIILAIFLTLITLSAEASSTKQNACSMNQRTLSSAIEMYDLDQPEPLKEWPPGIWKQLEREGYLKTGVPVCPGPSFTFMRTRGGQSLMERWFPQGFIVDIPCSSAPEYRLDESGTVYCTAHGPENGMLERAEQARNGKLGFVTAKILDVLSIDFVLYGIAGLLLLGITGMTMRTGR